MFLTFCITIFAFVLIAAIVWLSKPVHVRERTRQDYLVELARYFEGKLSAMGGKEDAQRMEFDFEGQRFILEDFREASFNKGKFKAVLKAPIALKYTLYFTEKAEKTTIRSNIIMASEIKDDPQKRLARVRIPKVFEKFNIETSDAVLTNQLFENPKILRLFVNHINTDHRKISAISLRIINGEVILDYQNQSNFKPSYSLLITNPTSLEDELLNILTLVQAIRNLSL